MKTYRMLTGLLWLSIPLMAISYMEVWNQLPLRMATHFDMANRSGYAHYRRITILCRNRSRRSNSSS